MLIGMNKCGCIHNISLMIVVVFVLYDQVTPSNAFVTSCSWSMWSPWNCSCCTRYYNIPTKRFRIKCCSNTKECLKLPITAKLVVHTDDDQETNSNCENKCSKNLILKSPGCNSTAAYFQPDRNLSCQHVCLAGPINGVYASTPPNHSHTNDIYQEFKLSTIGTIGIIQHGVNASTNLQHKYTSTPTAASSLKETSNKSSDSDATIRIAQSKIATTANLNSATLKHLSGSKHLPYPTVSPDGFTNVSSPLTTKVYKGTTRSMAAINRSRDGSSNVSSLLTMKVYKGTTRYMAAVNNSHDGFPATRNISSPNNTQSSTIEKTNDGAKINVGVVIGSVCGSLVALATLAAIILLLKRKKRGLTVEPDNSSEKQTVCLNLSSITELRRICKCKVCSIGH